MGRAFAKFRVVQLGAGPRRAKSKQPPRMKHTSFSSDPPAIPLRKWNHSSQDWSIACVKQEAHTAKYRNDGDQVYVEKKSNYVEKKSNADKVVGAIVVLAIVIAGVQFLTGFWSADISGGALPNVNVSAKGGDLPEVTLHSKEVVVGTTKQTVTVPKVETKRMTIDVPTVGVKDSSKN